MIVEVVPPREYLITLVANETGAAVVLAGVEQAAGLGGVASGTVAASELWVSVDQAAVILKIDLLFINPLTPRLDTHMIGSVVVELYVLYQYIHENLFLGFFLHFKLLLTLRFHLYDRLYGFRSIPDLFK
jgi:hypothetical protein